MLKSRLHLVALAGSVGFFLVVGWLSLSTAKFGETHDDGIYTVTGRSLAETGEYRIISLPGEPFQRKYPVVFPALLSVVWRIAGDFPGNIVWLKSVSLLAGAVFLCSAYGLLRTVGASGWAAALIVGAVLPVTGAWSNIVMSELAYGAISMLALWLLERAVRGNTSPVTGLAAGWVAGLAYQTRTVGLALVMAMIIVMVWRRRWRSLAGGMVGVGLAVGVCRLWQGPASEVPLVYEYYVNYGNWFLHTVRDLGWRYVVVVPLKNLILCALVVGRTALPVEMYDLSRSAPKQFAVVVAAVLIWSTLVPGWIRRRGEVWAVYLALYFAFLLAWPFPPGQTRFIVPVLPLILLAMWEGFQGMRPSARMVCATGTIAGMVVIVAAIANGYVRLTNVQVKPSLHRYEWIRSNTAPGDVIACVLDPNCYLYTGRKAVSIVTIADVAPFYGPPGKFQIRPEKLAEMVRTSNATYVMVEPYPPGEWLSDLARDAIGKLQQDSPGQLEEVWHGDSEEAMIYRVREVKSSKGTPLSLR